VWTSKVSNGDRASYWLLIGINSHNTFSKHTAGIDHLSAPTSEESISRKKKKAGKPHPTAISVNMTSRGRDPTWSRRGRHGVRAPSISSRDPDYNPGLSQVLIEPEGTFRGTRSKVAIPYNYEQPSSFRTMSPVPLRSLFQWSDNKGEASEYASSATVSFKKRGWCLSTWLTTTSMKIFISEWRHKNRLPKLCKKSWKTFSKC